VYANDGDWVESLTALVEHADGWLEIVDASSATGCSPAFPAGAASSRPERCAHEDRDRQ
jgi:hypothetical protein